MSQKTVSARFCEKMCHKFSAETCKKERISAKKTIFEVFKTNF